MRPYRPRHCAGGKRFVTFPGADARSLHQRRPRDRRVLPRRIRRAAERARCAIRLYCFQFAAKLGVLLGEHLVFPPRGLPLLRSGRRPRARWVSPSELSADHCGAGYATHRPPFLKIDRIICNTWVGAGARSGILRGPSLSRLTTAGPGSRRPQRGPLRGDEVPQLLRSDVATVFRSVRGP